MLPKLLNLFLLFAWHNYFQARVDSKANPIRGGKHDTTHDAIWQISFQVQQQHGRFQHACGGSLISEQYVVTAAHCFVEINSNGPSKVFNFRKSTRIVIGTYDINDNKACFERKIHTVFIPRDYRKVNNQLLLADIALIKLDKPLGKHESSADGKFGLISLVEESDIDKYDKASGFVSGYGAVNRDDNGDWLFDGFRKTLAVKFTADNCPPEEKLRCVQYVDDHEDVQGFCKGDSGGPVYVKQQDKVTLVGIISRGPRQHCDLRPSSERVGKVTFVAEYLDFINKALNYSANTNDIVVLPDEAEAARLLFQNVRT